MNLAISFRSCQSNRELANEVVKFTPNFVEKLYQVHYERSSRQIGEIVSEFPYTLWLRRLGITSFKIGYKTLQLNFPRCHRHLPKHRIRFLSRWSSDRTSMHSGLKVL